MTKNFSKIFTGAIICATSTAAFANSDDFSSAMSYAKSGFSVGIDGGYGYLSSPEAAYPNGEYKSYYSNFPVPIIVYYKYTDNSDTGDFVWGAHINYDFKIKPNLLMGFEFGYKDLGRSSYGYDYYDLSHGTPGGETLSHNLTQREEDYGDLLNASRSYHQNAVDLLLTAHCYFYKGFNIFGKAGLAYVRSNTNQSVSTDEPNIIPYIIPMPLEALNGDNDIWRFEPEVSLGLGYTFNKHFDIHAAYTYIGGASDQPIIDTSINNSSQAVKGGKELTAVYGTGGNNNAMYLPKAKVYSTNMITMGISYTF